MAEKFWAWRGWGRQSQGPGLFTGVQPRNAGHSHLRYSSHGNTEHRGCPRAPATLGRSTLPSAPLPADPGGSACGGAAARRAAAAPPRRLRLRAEGRFCVERPGGEKP